MCKLTKALKASVLDPEAIATLRFDENDVERIIEEAQIAIEDDQRLIEETTPSNTMLQNRIERAEKRIAENENIVNNGNALLEMLEKNAELFTDGYED